MSKCVICNKENNSGCDICDKCQEDIYAEEYYKQIKAQELANWERACMEEHTQNQERLKSQF